MRRDLAICFALAVLTAAAYGSVCGHAFLDYDDNGYVTANEHVHNGLNWREVGWAFTTTSQSNWHPLTWLSHMLDCQVFGTWAGGHHLTSLVLHIINASLLYLVLRRMTGTVWQSAMVAGLFALHPLHVESVAWVAERKDVLSTMLGLLTLGAYARYVERPGLMRYSAVFLLYALGLLAKPMLVTLPCVLLLLDYWPLERLSRSWKGRTLSDFWKAARPLLIEKTPLFALAGVSCATTAYAQRVGGAMVSVDRLALPARLCNAVLAYVGYIEKMFLPVHLAPFYPHPWELSVWPALGAGAFLLVLSAVLLWAARRRPYLAVGWLWYLGMLVPVIGLVQVGWQSMADRYTYLPLVGLFVLMVWGVTDLAAQWRPLQRALPVLAVAVLTLCSVLTWRQVGYWSDGLTLFNHALEVTGPNPVACNNVGLGLKARGKRDQAEEQFRLALKILPTYFEAHGNLGNLLAERNQFNGAVQEYRTVLQLNPSDKLVYRQLGIALTHGGKLAEAEACFREALRRNPSTAAAYFDLAMALQQQGKTEEAIKCYREAMRRGSSQSDALNNLAWILATHPDPRFRNGSEAVRLIEQALALSAKRAASRLDTLAAAYAEAGQFGQAVAAAREALAAARGAKQADLIAELESRVALFEKGRPYRDPSLLGKAAPGNRAPQPRPAH